MRTASCAAAAAVLAALTAPATATNHVRVLGGCDLTGVSDPVDRGVVSGAVFVTASGQPATVNEFDCEIYVNDSLVENVSGDIAGPASNIGYVEPTPVEIDLDAGDTFDLCTVVRYTDSANVEGTFVNCASSDGGGPIMRPDS